jgi:hypothetical protein
VAELVYALVSEAKGRKPMRVQVSPPAHLKFKINNSELKITFNLNVLNFSPEFTPLDFIIYETI